MRKRFSLLPLCLLTLLVFSQLFLYFSKNEGIELESVKKALLALITDGAKDYRTIKNPTSEPLYIFAQNIDRDIPLESKILYLNSTEVGVNTVIYYQINTYIPRNHSADYVFKTNPTVNEIVSFMKKSGADYVVDYNNQNIIGQDGKTIRGKPAIYGLDNNTIKLFKEYD